MSQHFGVICTVPIVTGQAILSRDKPVLEGRIQMKNWIKVMAPILALGALLLGGWSPALAADSCPDHTPVTIDIKPGSSTNNINLGAKGSVPVAILTTATFDASQFTPEMAQLVDANTTSMDCMNANAVRYTRQDVNGDGKADLVLFFDTTTLNFTTSTTAATLMAHGEYNGSVLHIMGTDSVVIVP